MKLYNKQTGFVGEDLAVKELQNKGYEILERNFSNKFGEIDIITKHKDILVFVEVKTKRGEIYGSPEEMINPKKLWKIRNMANLYMLQRPACRQAGLPCRIDVIAIVLGENNEILRLTHYENVY